MENPKKRNWKVLTSEYLARKPWFTVRHESIELPDGRRIPDYYVFEYPNRKLRKRTPCRLLLFLRKSPRAAF